MCSTSRTLDTAIINLITRSGKTLRLSVLIVPFFATPLQNMCCINVISLPHLHNLKLAHPLTADREFKISLLVGADHYWDIVIFNDHAPTSVVIALNHMSKTVCALSRVFPEIR